MFGATIFLSAFLLFSVQPMIAKLILPWFGGSAAVWTTCLVFFQTALLAGYSYSWRSSQWSPRARWLYITLLLIAIALLPVEPGARWRPDAGSIEHPGARILWLLTAVVGLPYVLLSMTSPLLQKWYARPGAYRLFALSNAGALIALIAYPIWIEPNMAAHAQARWWSIGFVAFAVLAAAAAWMTEKIAAPLDDALQKPRIEWVTLSAAGSMLLLATTNQLTQNVAPVPMLWLLPLAIYLLTFIIAFERPAWYRRDQSLRLLAIALAAIAYAISDIKLSDAIVVSIPMFCGGLFLGCLFCHGELYRLRPEPSQLTAFYWMIAAGGALGAVFVGLIAPVIFSGIYELPVAMLAVACVALWMNRDRGPGLKVLWSAIVVAMIALSVNQVIAYHRNAVTLERSFYGSLRVVDADGVRTLFHGIIQHGSQFLAEDRRRTPTTYYGSTSGAAVALNSQGPRRVGVIGLGAGTLAAYGRAGDEFHFYEINPQVVAIARQQFSYLRDSAAKIRVTLGDARLSLESEARGPEANGSLDVLMVDAFSGDAIPVHLLTQEAFAIYRRHLKPDGILAIHVSNQYLDLTPVVARLAADSGLQGVEIRNAKDEAGRISEAVWILMARNRDFSPLVGIRNSSTAIRALPAPGSNGARLWTDDYNNLFQVMRWNPLQ